MSEGILTAIEVTAVVDAEHQLHLDSPLPIRGPRRVRVIVLYSLDEEIEEGDWLAGAVTSPAFDFLYDPAEDIYTLADGEPFHDEV